ncbi:MAG: type II toxin-antitoxin system RelE/ParE family toxin [Clostridia bacterium]|nr:type II toxin-antitoxin system RelE/ParE family toxin [Clostridia bacterium]
MSDYEVRISKKAYADIWNIHDYIAKERYEPESADRLVEHLLGSAMEIGHFPLKYPLIGRKKFAKSRLHKKVDSGYILLYRVYSGKRFVRIIRILHGRTDWLRHI